MPLAQTPTLLVSGTIVHVHVVLLVINVKSISDLVKWILVGTTVPTFFFILYVTLSIFEVHAMRYRMGHSNVFVWMVGQMIIVKQ